MSVPIAAVDLLSENLTQLLVYNYHMVADVKENISRLATELTSMRLMMVNFAKYNSDSDTMKQTVKEMRQILDKTEDAVDTYVLQACVQKSRSFVSRSFHNMTDMPVVFRELERQIEYMAAKVKQINKETLRRGLEVLQYQEISQLSQPGKSTETEALRVEGENVVGFERATAEVAKLLLTGCENLEVISIAGMSGLGKTTLGRQVFKDPLVEFEYRIRAFVYVSRDFSRRDVLRRILASITKSKKENRMSEEELENGVFEVLKDKHYLVVLDDIWETEDWDMLKGVFPINEKCQCRVLITTRNERVAEYANPKNPESLYRLDFLTLEKSQLLLRRRIFNNGDIPESLLEYEVNIAWKCDGLPLALVLVAGILVNHPNREDWWKAVASSVKDYIARDSARSNQVIEMMYEHLPNHLKICFLYFGVFRENFAIPIWKLVHLWVSEGFIERGGETNLENVAEKYLEELVQRNLVMVGRRRSNGKIKSCRIHDSLLQFCKAKAREENLFQEIDKDLSLSGKPSLDMDYCRRLCINNASITDYILGGPSGKHVRSFLTFVKEDQQVDAPHVSAIPKTFKLLRVLEAESLIFSRFPSDLCSLVLLKYLAIAFTINIIPTAFSSLWNLQTLIVGTTHDTLEVKADLWRMPQFRHLHTSASARLPSPGAKKHKEVSSIQTLCNIAPESCQKEAFDLTPNLRKLGIFGEFSKVDGGSGLLQLLAELKSLENLKLLSNDENLTAKFQFNDLPRHLTNLTLMKTRLGWEQMSEIGELETLEDLKLKEFAFQGALWNTQTGGFRRLKHLYIGRTDLVTWEASEDHFPNLKRLQLNATDKLQTFPPGLASISSLQYVALSYIHPDVAHSARKLQESSSFSLSVYPPIH